MFLISSQVLVDSASVSSVPECERSPSAKSNPIAAPSSPSTGQESLSWETYVPWGLNRSPPWGL